MTRPEPPSSLHTWLLVDAAMLRGTPMEGRLQAAAPDTVPLYGDLGDEAESVGPWLVPSAWSDSLLALPLPARLCISELQTTGDAESLFDHFKRIRHLEASDGQRFYFRFADTRALHAANRALPLDLLSVIKGPMVRWSWIDRHGAPCELGAGSAPAEAGPLKLSPDVLEALMDAGAADRMALSLDELGEPRVQPTLDARQFRYVEDALAHCRQIGLDPWPLQRAVARQAVLFEGANLLDEGFKTAVLTAKAQGTSEPIEHWRPRS